MAATTIRRALGEAGALYLVTMTRHVQPGNLRSFEFDSCCSLSSDELSYKVGL